jgi:tRNA nucleotidyltransferase (CCA-adding enzyme)
MRLPALRARKVTKRLRVARLIAENVQAASQLWADLPAISEAQPSAFTMRLDKVPRAATYAVYCATDDQAIRNKLHTYITDWCFITPQTTGHDLHERGLPPGPQYSEILILLRQAWLDGEVRTSEDEIALLEKLIENQSNQSDD